MIMTRGVSLCSASFSVKSRPRRMRTPIVEPPGVIAVRTIHRRPPPRLPDPFSPQLHTRQAHDPASVRDVAIRQHGREGGRPHTSSRTRWSAANIVRCAAASSCRPNVKSISVEDAALSSNQPGFEATRPDAPRKNRPALKRSMSESAICAITSKCRGAKKRLSRPTCADSPTCCFKSFTQIGPRRLQRSTPRLREASPPDKRRRLP